MQMEEFLEQERYFYNLFAILFIENMNYEVFFFLSEILLPTLIETGSAAAACLRKFCCKINVVKLMSILFNL